MFLGMTLVALLFLSITSSTQVSKISQLKNRNDEIARESRIQSRIIAIMGMVPKNDNDHAAIRLAGIMSQPTLPRMFLLRTGNETPLFDESRDVRLVDVDGLDGGLELLLLSTDEAVALLALFDDDRLIATQARDENAFECREEFTFDYVNNDEILDVCIKQISATRQRHFQLAVRKTGFQYIVDETETIGKPVKDRQ